MPKESFSRFREFKNSNYKKLLFKRKEKEKKSRGIKSRRYTIESNEFEKKIVLFKDTDDNIKDKKKHYLKNYKLINVF